MILLMLSCFGISITVFVWPLCSVHLARRVLQLERQNTSLRRELEIHKSQAGQISQEVHTHTHHTQSASGSSLFGFTFHVLLIFIKTRRVHTCQTHLFFPPPQLSHSNSAYSCSAASVKVTVIYYNQP